MNYVPLETIAIGTHFVSQTNFFATAQFIYTVFFFIVIFTAMMKILITDAEKSILEMYGLYNDRTTNTQEEWNKVQREMFHDFMRAALGFVILFFLFLALSAFGHSLLN
jgi:hypothetical protein